MCLSWGPPLHSGVSQWEGSGGSGGRNLQKCFILSLPGSFSKLQVKMFPCGEEQQQIKAGSIPGSSAAGKSLGIWNGVC